MRRALIVLALAGATLVLAGVAAYAVDTALTGGDVARNVELGGRRVGGLGPRELDLVTAEVADQVERSDITVQTPAGSFTIAASDVSLEVDAEATAEAARHAGRSGFAALRPWRWASSFLHPRQAPVVASFDRDALARRIAKLDPTERVPPVEPSFQVVGGEVVVAPPRAGRGIDSDPVAQAVEEQLRRSRVPVTVTAVPTTLHARFTIADAEPFADAANRITEPGITVSVDGERARLDAAAIRPLLRLGTGGGALGLRFRRVPLQAALAQRLPRAGVAPVDAGFVIDGGRVVITPARPGTGCCSAGAATTLLRALSDGRRRAELELTTVVPARSVDEASELGVREEVSTFTTYHACCESRVTNIHRIADIVRGAVIEPGQTFSVNEFVGPRTVEKGFVEAGVIYKGRFEADIGGGVSQFATTLFNAAFFAGLDFAEYQSHSIYISRYPYGREATISYPQPDLRIRNPTRHAVLIWPTYTDSSLTISLWSTKTVEVEQSGQSAAPAGSCTRVTTERTRRFPGGRVEVDRVYAVYRPGEGVSC